MSVCRSVEPVTDPTGQLDLLAWRPKPWTPVLLSLFGEPEEPKGGA